MQEFVITLLMSGWCHTLKKNSSKQTIRTKTIRFGYKNFDDAVILTFWIVIAEQNMEEESFQRTYALVLTLFILQKTLAGQTKKCTLTISFLQCQFFKSLSQFFKSKLRSS